MKTNFLKLAATATLMACAGQAFALSLTAGDADWTYNKFPPNNITIAEIFSVTGVTVTTILFKDDGAESGTLADDYNGSFTDSSISLTWVGPDSASCPECILVIKDGNNDPTFYLYDLGSWDGMESISVTGLWPGNGAVSHFEIWGGDDPTTTTTTTTTTTGEVPEPGSLALLGAGLLGLGLMRRKRRS